jgi:putative flavoprotein involved in K+ transport
MTTTERFETVIIGAGQAGLATGYHLAKRGRNFVILEAHAGVGDVWRTRFDSLRLYSPAKYDGLPGWGMPLSAWTYPGKDEVADYLEAYARKFDLPIRTSVSVDRLVKHGDRYLVCAGEHRYEADNVVVATGTWPTPITPPFAAELDPGIRQLHSHDYRNPAQLQDGPVLVVGAAHSGADIALEVSAGHPTTLSGPVRGEVPFNIEGKAARMLLPILWFAANHVLTERTPVGRKMGTHIRSGGGPLLRVKRSHLEAAGVEHIEEKVAGVDGGKPVLADGRVLDVRNVVWCTGFRKDIDWIALPVAGEDGYPQQKRGVVESQPGLYFVGLPFLQAFASMLVGGVGRDAEYVARHIAKRRLDDYGAVDEVSGTYSVRSSLAPSGREASQ